MLNGKLLESLMGPTCIYAPFDSYEVIAAFLQRLFWPIFHFHFIYGNQVKVLILDESKRPKQLKLEIVNSAIFVSV